MTRSVALVGLIVGCPTCGCWLDEPAAAQARRRGRTLLCPQCAGPVVWPTNGPEAILDTGPDADAEESGMAGEHGERGGHSTGVSGCAAPVRPRRVSVRRRANGVAASEAAALGTADQSGSTDLTRPS